MPGSDSQKKKNARLTVSLVTLIITSAVFYYFLNGRPSQVAVNPDVFHVDNQEKVDRVVLRSPQGQVELKFDGSRWRVNDRYDADRQMIKVLFATLDRAKAKRLVSANMQDSISALLTQKGTEVSLFAGGELVKKFQAGGNSRKTESWFKEPDGKAYVMVIPGYRAYVAYVVELGEEEWRDKRIFNFNWRNFRQLKVTVPADAGQGFEVTFADKYFTIPNLNRVDTTRLNDYLDAVSLLAADRIITRSIPPVYDSLIKTRPSFELEVKDIADQNYSLIIWPPVKNDPNALGRWGEDEVVLFRREQIIPIARKRSYFSGQ